MLSRRDAVPAGARSSTPSLVAPGLSRRVGSAIAALYQLAAMGLPIRMAFRELSLVLDDMVRYDTALLVLPGSSKGQVDLLACFEYLGPSAQKSPRWLEHCWSEAGIEREELPAEARRLDPISTNMALAGRYYRQVIGNAPPAGTVSIDLVADGRSIGELTIHREAPFSAEDLDLYRRAYRSIVRLAANTMVAESLERLHVAERGLAYCSASQGVMTRSANAVRLMRWARRSHDGTCDFLNEREPLWGGVNMPSPRHRRAREVSTNAFGRFEISRLPMFELEGAAVESVQVDRLTPAELQIFSSASFRALSPRQRDVVIGLVRGKSHVDIASDLASAVSTVVTHVRNIYERTGVLGREELTTMLLAEAEACDQIPTPPKAQGAVTDHQAAAIVTSE